MELTNHHHPDPAEPQGGRITVKGPAALAAALPYLFDHCLAQSLVIAWINPDCTLGMTVHHRLPECPRGASPEVLRQWAGDVGRIGAAGARAMGQHPEQHFAVVVYLPEALGQPPRWFGPAVMEQGLHGAPGLLDAVAVFGERWRSLVCVNDSCCPPGGLVIMDNSDAALVAAELVAAGLMQHGDGRAASLAAMAEVDRLLAAKPYPATVKARRQLLHTAWPVVRRPPHGLDPETAAMLIMAADRPGVRDALLARMAARAGGSVLWYEQLALWSAVARLSPPSWLAGPACMTAIAAWSLQDTAAALVAVEMALEAEPGHRMASLIGSLLDSQTPASVWFDRMRGIAEGDCLRFDRPPAAERSALHGLPRAAG